MTLVVDAAPLVATADELLSHGVTRSSSLGLLLSERGGLFVPAPVTAEIDYLLGNDLAPPARRAFLEDLAARRYESPGLDASDYAAALELDSALLPTSTSASAGSRLTGDRTQARDAAHPHVRRTPLPGSQAPLQGGVFVLLPTDSE